MARILVIEDNEDMRTMLVFALRLSGFEVAGVADGLNAVAALERAPAEAIVTDLFMPDQDGIETIEEVRRRFPLVKIIAMSGWQSAQGPDYLEVAREIGAVHTLRKPFDPEELVAVLRKVL
ncbi:MAG TPA: response regulator [Burkholderiales bacterium]|nr:response regulator [Burkholderiales bacterium]